MERTRNIALVGCGQLGSRHLQAIARLGGDVEVQVVEPNPESRWVGQERLQEVIPSGRRLRVQWLTGIEQLNGRADLTIVATLSAGRMQLIERLLAVGHRRFLIEKMVCQSKGEYERLIESFHRSKAKGWVNTIRRYNDLYRKIAPFFQSGPFTFCVSASNLGLGSNAIHYLDLFALCSGSPRISLNGGGLSQELLPNRRRGDMVEFSGTVTGMAGNGSFAAVVFHPVEEACANVFIAGEEARAVVDEIGGKALVATRGEGWEWKRYEYREPRVSEITSAVAQDLLERDSCLLPTLEASYPLHAELFRIFNQHIKGVSGELPRKCPIT